MPNPVTQTIKGTFSDIHTEKKHDLGTTVLGDDGNLYMYCQGIASNAAYKAVTVESSFVVALLVKAQLDKLYPVGISQAAFLASQFGWVCIHGRTKVNALASCAKEVALYTCATAGSVDDDATSQTKVNRIVLEATVGGSAADTACIISYPSAQ